MEPPVAHRDKARLEGPPESPAATAYADGYADGEAYRARKQAPPAYLLLGFDEYAQGFQTGYYGEAGLRPRLDARVTIRRDDE